MQKSAVNCDRLELRKPMAKAFYFLTIGLCLLLFTGCDFMPQVSTVEGQERDEIVAQVEPIADNLFEAINAGNYIAFSRDFDETMKKALDEKAFNEMIQFFTPKIGAYQSRVIEKVELVDTLFVITYKAQYEQENAVSVRLSLRQGNPIQIASLFFDSPKLREK